MKILHICWSLATGGMENMLIDIIICHTDTPKDFSIINFIRTLVSNKNGRVN